MVEVVTTTIFPLMSPRSGARDATPTPGMWLTPYLTQARKDNQAVMDRTVRVLQWWALNCARWGFPMVRGNCPPEPPASNPAGFHPKTNPRGSSAIGLEARQGCARGREPLVFSFLGRDVSIGPMVGTN